MLLVGFRLVMLLSYNGLCKSDIKTSENFVVVFWYVRVMYLLLRDCKGSQIKENERFGNLGFYHFFNNDTKNAKS